MKDRGIVLRFTAALGPAELAIGEIHLVWIRSSLTHSVNLGVLQAGWILQGSSRLSLSLKKREKEKAGQEMPHTDHM